MIISNKKQLFTIKTGIYQEMTNVNKCDPNYCNGNEKP